MTATTTETITAATSDLTYIPRGPATAGLTFYAPPPDNAAPYNYVEPQPSGQLQRNYLENEQKVTITDIRNAESAFTLNKDAFQTFQKIPTSTNYQTFNSETSIREIYYPEVESLLLSSIPGAHKVVLFDHTIRRQKDGAPRQPVTRVHVDQTRRAAADRVRLHIQDPEEAEKLLKERYRIVNVWRSLTDEPVQSAPLAFASATSVNPDDLVPVQHRYPNRVGETLGVKFNQGQKWYYWSGMTPDERLLLKCSDSAVALDLSPGIGESVPHTAFWDQRTPVGARGRESIEVRALVFG
ncbi:uncharacterized protein N7511_010944 [Penicillium nucicola]|uniref:uncharacterized protein n=1 Tax=Penicillium nucicola TaxID=1850975 RepID=UPI002544DAC3|nr:uncharacterized protein N7511_010944 [Penicillium nucicola]KAJ5749248.1 hypothetical protein N7511_010944 [Penicillium nucicola]